MNAYSRNIVANLLGNGWLVVVQLAVVPAVVWIAGVESYALLGFYASLLAVLSILDLGLSPTLTRSMAAGPVGASRLPHLLRTYEVFFFAVGIAGGLAIALGADAIAGQWLSSSALSETQVRDSVRLMGLLFALRWPTAPSVATLQGLQKQLGLNVVNAAAGAAAGLGGIAVLLWIEPRIEVFLAWQCVCAAAQAVALRILAARALPAAAGGVRFDARLLMEGWRFASGMMVISITAVILTQGDKLILSKLVPLEEFGYYSVALAVSSALYVIISPVFNATLPSLVERAAAADEGALREAYRTANELMGALLIPVGVFLALFAYEVLLVWTRNALVAERGAVLLSLLSAGILLNGLMNVPYALQLARGNTAIGIGINSVLCLILVPAMYVLTASYGVAGGAAVSPILNGLYFAFGLPLIRRFCLPSASVWRFYADLLRRQGLAIALLVAARFFLPMGGSAIVTLVELALILLACVAASVLLSPGLGRVRRFAR
jgi:O-antigen/teichoic acid export membrane protein